MHNKLIGTLFVVFGLTLAAAPVFASKQECDHMWGAKHEQDGGARFDQHMSKLHDALKLTSAQEAAFTEFSNKIKPAKADTAQMDKSRSQDWKNMSAPDRLDKILENMKSREAKMGEHAAAVHTFYVTLTPDQQKIFDRHFEKFQSRHDHEQRPHGHEQQPQDKSNSM